MKKFTSILLYLSLLFLLSALLFFILGSIWGTDEPVIAYLLSVIVTFLILNEVERMGKGKEI